MEGILTDKREKGESPRLFIVAGEPSGDMHAANLIHAMRRQRVDCEFAGLGGSKMEEAGCRLERDMMTMSWMGFAKAIVSAPMVYAFQRRMIRFLRGYRPDAVVLVDFPGFNLSLARLVGKLGIPVVYYISPQIWAWAPGRIEKIRQRVAKMLVIFPFEEEIYRRAGVPVEYVGHPLFDELAAIEGDLTLPEELKDPAHARTIGLLPGSRAQVVKRSLGVMFKAAARIHEEIPETRFLVSCQQEQFEGLIGRHVERAGFPVKVVGGRAQVVMKNSELCLVASGTATLELAHYGTPMVVIYRVGPASFVLGRALLKSPYFCLVNILAGREVVPEMLLWRDDIKRVTGHALSILQDHTVRERTEADLKSIREMVDRTGASDRAAEAVLRFVDEHGGMSATAGRQAE